MPLSKRKSISFEERVQLTAEMSAPYRKLRQFVYLACSASGGVGAFVFFFRVLAGRELDRSLPSLALQVGIVSGAIALFRWENRRQKRLEDRVRINLKSQKPAAPTDVDERETKVEEPPMAS